QVDQRIHQPPAWEGVPDQNPGKEQPQNQVYQRCGKGGSESQQVRGAGPLRPHCPPKIIEGKRSCLEKACGDRDENQNAEVKDRVPQGQRETRQHSPVNAWHIYSSFEEYCALEG